MTSQKKMTTVKLSKNTSFPTYQLYAQVENKELSPEDRLKVLVLETVKWLRSRFENIDIPDKLNLVGPEDYKSFDLNIFKDGLHIEEGYSLDIIYLEDEGIWAMNLVEPDLALGIGQKRQGVPGRKFSTNIAFKISDNEVECGFKTICIEPEGTNEECEVFRIAVVKEIVRNNNLGLRQVFPLREGPFKIKTFEELRNFLSFVENNQRQIPIVLLAEYREKDFEDISKEYFKEKLNFTGVNTISNLELEAKEFKKILSKDKAPKSKLSLDFGKNISYKMSQGHFFYLDYELIEKYNNMLVGERLSPGALHLIFPKNSNRKNLSYSLEEIKAKREPIRNIVLSNLENYTKYRDINYGQVKFYNEANIILENKIQKESKDAREIIESLKKEIALEKNRCEEEKNRQSNELAELIRQNEKYLLEISVLEEELYGLKNKAKKEESEILKSYKKKIESKRDYIGWLESNRERPNKLEDIPEWVDKHLAGRLIFHDRAKNEIRSTKNNIDVKIVCDSLDYLAWEYYDYLFNGLDKDTMYSLCSKKYQRPFDVGGSGNMSVECYPVDYKIKYKTGFKGKPVETPLNMHLKIGNDNKNILRIYFLIDKEKELIVVGSLPDHLPTLNFQ